MAVLSLVSSLSSLDFHHNDYGLDEAKKFDQEQWVAAGETPAWALPMLQNESGQLELQQAKDGKKSKDDKEKTKDNTAIRHAQHNPMLGDEYKDTILPIGPKFPNPELFIPLPGLPSAMGAGLVKETENDEEGEEKKLYCPSKPKDQVEATSNQHHKRNFNFASLDPVLDRKHLHRIKYDQPTIGDWWATNTTEVLRAYMDEWAGTNFTNGNGVFTSLAACYGMLMDNELTVAGELQDNCDKLHASLGTNSTSQPTFIVIAFQNFIAINDLIYVRTLILIFYI